MRNMINISDGQTGGQKVLFVMATSKKYDVTDQSMESVQVLLDNIRPPASVRSDLVVESENKDGLPKIYNTVLSDFGNQYDIIVFIHDDLVVSDCQIYDKLFKAKEQGYDLVGCCGGKGWEFPENANPETNPIGWNVATYKFGCCGIMIHRYEGHTFATPYGQEGQTLTIDGSFMALMNGSLAKGLKFNEHYTFHHYDMAVSMDAWSMGLKCGTCGIICTHGSIGLGIRTKEFLDSQKLFLKEYFNRG